MKQGQLLEIAHNLGASIASGYCTIIGPHDAFDIYSEARVRSENSITVDLLDGHILGAPTSEALTDVIQKLAFALPEFCEKHDVSRNEFTQLDIRFRAEASNVSFTINVADSLGRKYEQRYVGRSAKKAQFLDHLGRIRRKSPKPSSPT